MKIIRVPLRISLFGGGTDRPRYYEKHGSTIISFAIDKYMHIVYNQRPTGGCRLSYSKVEELETLRSAQHSLVRATAEQYGFQEPCTLTIVSDVPKGTGLGSSSALAVALCKLTDACEKRCLGLATTAFCLEHSVHPEVGMQDHLPAVFGGFNMFNLDEQKVMYTPMPDSAVDLVNQYGLLLYTGIARNASDVLKNWTSKSTLHKIHSLAEEQVEAGASWTPYTLGKALDKTWKLKMRIPGVCSLELHDQYARAIEVGAYGGKLLGAGAGGCWFFMVDGESRDKVKEELGLIEIPYQVSEKGVEEWEI